MSRTVKYFFIYLAKVVALILAMGVYTYFVGRLLTEYFGLSNDLSAVLMFGVPFGLGGLYIMWDAAKHKVELENKDLMRKIKG